MAFILMDKNNFDKFLITVKIKKLFPDVKVPKKGRQGDAAYDLFSREDYLLRSKERHLFKLGFAIEINAKYVALVWDRSGMATNYGIHSLAGVIDSNYRGEVSVVLLNTSDKEYQIKKGDRLAQMLIQKVENVKLQEVDTLSGSERGERGWLSSGK